MSVKDKSILKIYFDDGARPTGSHFEDLIDSLSHINSGFANGGNTFGSNASIGTNDAHSLQLKTNNEVRMSVNSDGLVTMGNASGTSNSLPLRLYNYTTNNSTAKMVELINSYNGQGHSLGTRGPSNYFNIINTATNNYLGIYSVNNTTIFNTGDGASVDGSYQFRIGTTSDRRFSIHWGSGLAPTSGTYNALVFDVTTYNPTSGNATLNIVSFNNVYNQTETAIGTIRGIYYNPTVTSVLGTHYAFESTSGRILFTQGTTNVNYNGAFTYTMPTETSTSATYNSTNGIKIVGTGTGATTHSIWATANSGLMIGSTNNPTMYVGASGFYVGGGISQTGAQIYGLMISGNNVTTGNGLINMRYNSSISATGGAYTIANIQTANFAPGSGNADLVQLRINGTYNQTGTANGIIRGIYYNPTATSVRGSHYAWESASGDMAVGGTGRYMLNDGGTLKVALERTDSHTLRIGGSNEFGTLLVPSAISRLASGSIVYGGSLTITTSNGLDLTRQAIITSTDQFGVRLNSSLGINGSATYRSLTISHPVSASTSGIVSLFEVIPSISSLSNILYGARFKVNTGFTGGGTAWNIYADGSAANYFGGDIINKDTNAIYLGDPDTDGTYRIKRDGNNLITERRESGAYVVKQTITP